MNELEEEIRGIKNSVLEFHDKTIVSLDEWTKTKSEERAALLAIAAEPVEEV